MLDASEAPPTFQVGPDRIIGLIAGGDRSLRHSSEGKEDDREGAAADVIVYDNLVAPPILDLAPVEAERIYVGKKAADHSLPQDEINQLLLELADRLKDPSEVRLFVSQASPIREPLAHLLAMRWPLFGFALLVFVLLFLT